MKSTSIKTFIFFVLIMAFSLNLIGQNQAPELKNVVPPSPTTASLGKYGEIPVGLYTGTPNISIPIYEISDGPLSLPISLSYHAAGVRVEEIASDVGLGWTLNAGGVVGRQIRGLVDEYGWVKPYSSRISTILQSGTSSEKAEMQMELNAGIIDGEADLYYYNMAGRSGKFLFNEDGSLHNYPAENIAIQPIGGTNYFGTGWEVVDENGTIYEFDDPEIVHSSPCIGSGVTEKYTAWYLTKITSADGKSEIEFIYDYVDYSIQMSSGNVRYFLTSGGNNCATDSDCISTHYYETKQLTQINFSGGHVEFEYNTAREDIPGLDRLDNIKIFAKTSNGDQLIKSYQLGFGYFGAGSTYADQKRLKLTSVTENISTGTKPPYLFTYEESIAMPSRLSSNKDHWGYYNGANNTTGGVPTFNFVGNSANMLINGGADRKANADTMQACILKKIEYPTGGETLFTYETNRSYDTRIEVSGYDETPYYLSDYQQWSSVSSPYQTGTFVVPTGNEVEVSFTMDGFDTSGDTYHCDGFYWYLLKDGVPTSYSGNYTQSLDGVTLDLDPGTYRFQIDFDCYSGYLDYYIVATVKVPKVNDGTILRHVGGLRIKQIEDKPGDGSQSVIRNYKYPVGGTLVNYPDYGYEATIRQSYYSGSTGGNIYFGCAVTCENYYVVVAASTNYPLATTNGSYVGYGKVIEDLGDNGEIEHIYNTYTDYAGDYPFPPIEMSDWQRGSELETSYYAIDGGGNRIPKKKVTYNYTSVAKGSIKGYRPSSDIIYLGCTPSIPGASYITYDVLPDFYYLSGTTERIYDENDPSMWIETNTVFKHDNTHYQQTEVVTSVSSKDGTTKDQLVVKRKYPQDYNTTSASGSEAIGLQTLNDLHVVNVPVEEYTIRQKINTSNSQVSNEHVVSGIITTFKPTDPYPDKILRLEKNNAMSLASYGSGSTISSNVFVKNPNTTINNSYTPAVEFNSYDDKGNLTMQRKADGTYITYIWGYQKQYPIAKIENATYSQISSYVPNLQTLSNSDDDSCRDSENCDEKNLRSALNVLRPLFPSAMITTYTYNPLVGVTSMTDPKGYTVYYEYDNFNRLKLVRDAEGNIASENSYNYKP